jgi:hypothetical protein
VLVSLDVGEQPAMNMSAVQQKTSSVAFFISTSSWPVKPDRCR